MSDPQVKLAEKARANLDYVLGPIPVGIRQSERLLVAASNINDRLERKTPRHGIRGGSSSSRAEEDRAEERRLMRALETDQLRLKELLGRIAKDTDELYRLVVRNVVTVAVDTLGPAPDPREAQWCTSCLRIQRCEPRGNPKEVGAESTLCTWCHRFEKGYGDLPPTAILEARAQGRRITVSMVDAAFASLSKGKRKAS